MHFVLSIWLLISMTVISSMMFFESLKDVQIARVFDKFHYRFFSVKIFMDYFFLRVPLFFLTGLIWFNAYHNVKHIIGVTGK